MSKNGESLSPVSFVSSVFKFSVATWINAALYLAAMFAVNLFVSKDVYGPYDLMISAAATLMSFVTLGLDHAYIRFYPEPPKGADGHGQIAAFGLSVSAAALAVFSAALLIPGLRAVLFGGFETALLVSMCFTALFMTVIRFFNITYRMQNNALMFSVVSVALQFFTRMFYIFGIFTGKSASALALFNLGGLGAFTLVFLSLRRKDMLPVRYSIKKPARAELFKYGIGIMPSGVLLWGNQLVNKFFVETSLGEGALGIFSFAAFITQALGIVQGGFANFWSAYVFGHYREEKERISKMHDFIMYVMAAMMCALILFSPLLFWVLSSYAECRPIFGIMLIAPLLMIVAETTVYGIEIAKKTVFNTLGSLLCFICNILLCRLLIPRFELTGAAIALSASTAVMFLFRTAAAQRHYRTIRSCAKTAVSLAVMAALSAGSYFLDGSHLPLAALSVSAFVFYSVIYREERKRIVKLAGEILARIFVGGKPKA